MWLDFEINEVWKKKIEKKEKSFREEIKKKEKKEKESEREMGAEVIM